ncbi:MAG: hypothetical protein IT254_11445 [Chitinophagaceae bacterium]|nr:hypothetical protein [Bacteroidota bacterium]MCC6258929.1 hypothetical protein [Chitinophagaceae bacterium]MCW5916470.1 hypothetical protein [Ferruginibacter sp.]
MMPEWKNKIGVILIGTLWVSLGAGLLVLLVAAVRMRDKQNCKGVQIQISGVSNNFFIDKTDIREIIAGHENNRITGRPVSDFDLISLEKTLEKEVWVKEAQLFFDNNNILNVLVEEREPVARIFTTSGGTFYIDSSSHRLPLSDKFSANVPVFTGFPSDVMIFSKPDSILLLSIRNLSMKIAADSFLMAMIDQVDITPQRYFEMIPKIGNQVIKFGDASDADKKFEKLKLFYKKVMTKVGWSRYSVINLQYRNQVVAKIRGKDDVKEDSLRTLQMMEIIAANAEKMAEDSIQQQLMKESKEKETTDESIIRESVPHDEGTDRDNITAENAKPQQRAIAPLKPQEKKPEPKKLQKPPVKTQSPTHEKLKTQPKAIMQKTNDY